MNERKITKQHIQNAKNPTGEQGKQTLERMNISHEELTNWALSFLKDNSPKNILDIGCGGGATVRRLINKYPASFVTGIDYSAQSIELSKELNADILGKKCDILCMDVHDMKFENESFDVITAFETIYFWSDLPKAFSQIKRILNKDAQFLICCESSDSSNIIWQDVLDDIRILSEQQWKMQLQANGFNVINTQKRGEWICIITKKI